MGKNILVIGGSYFAGRVFTFTAAEAGHRVTLINRGTYSMQNFGVTEFVCDRKNSEKLAGLMLLPHYDAIVDFCAYEPGDIDRILGNLLCSADQYIYISTADVTKPSEGIRNEDSPLRSLVTSDPVDQYGADKLALENELKNACAQKGMTYTILRPAFIFGPYNYAPRESWYIRMIVEGRPVPHPLDADGKFCFVYVKDVTKAILISLEKDEAKNQTYVLSGSEVFDYDGFMQLLKEVSDRPFETYPITVAEAHSQQIPFPFPLMMQENEIFDGTKIVRELGFSYEGIKEAMQKTYNAFRNAFAPR